MFNAAVPIMAQPKQILLVSMRTHVRSLALLGGLRFQHCCERWLQTWLGSCISVAVVQASSYSSDLTPSLGTSICCKCGPKKTKNKLNK